MEHQTLVWRFVCPIGPATQCEFILDWRILKSKIPYHQKSLNAGLGIQTGIRFISFYSRIVNGFNDAFEHKRCYRFKNWLRFELCCSKKFYGSVTISNREGHNGAQSYYEIEFKFPYIYNLKKYFRRWYRWLGIM